jgi:glycosyltransferase involved in cell wall biosynthesis
MGTPVDISVIIPVYNAMPLLERTLDSIFGQHTNYSFEVVLVDDGSTDNSVDYIKSRGEENIVLLQQANAGPSAARNRGVENANGRYCAYLDADDYWIDGFIEKTVSFLDENKDCIAVSVGQRHLTVSGEGIKPSCINDYHQSIILDDFWSFWSQYMHVCTGSVTIRTDILRQSSGQRTDLRVTEDLEFWALISTYGKWGFIPEVLFVSDGTSLVFDKDSWIKKMSVRWNNAPSVEEWQKRIVDRVSLNKGELPATYVKARGRISEILTYCQMLSGRYALSRQEAKSYADDFREGNMTRLIRICRHTRLTWWILCKMLRWREYHRY